MKLLGWQIERRFVVIREVVLEGRDSVGRKLIDVPGYVFRIFVTTHTMEEAERCTRVAIMYGGRVIASDTPAGLKEGYGGRLPHGRI